VTQTLRIATAGAGYFSQFHYDGWARVAGVRLEALCTLDQAEAEAAAKRYGVPRAFIEIEAMLDEARPDLLDIITPPATHLGLVRAAARRGIAVICQKPLAPTLAEAEELVRVAEDAGIQLVVHENFRFMSTRTSVSCPGSARPAS
jgi:predicted dehydrogenase